MRKKKVGLRVLFFLGVTALFFYKFFLLGKIPFPGELLVSEYGPWKSDSYLGYGPGTMPSKLQYFDTLRQIYPWKTFALDQLNDRSFPLWNPHNFSGQPLLANSQSAVFYPLNIFYFIFSQPIAWTILVVSQPFLTLIFTYFYAKEIKVSREGAILASTAFTYSLFNSVFLEYNTIGHVVLWLPLLLLAIEKILTIGNAKQLVWWSGIFVFAFTSAVLAGHLQIWGFAVGFAVLYALFRGSKLRRLTALGLLTLLALGISAIQLLPTLELIQNSARTSQEYNFLIENLLLQLRDLVLFLSPDFFGNPVTRNYLLADSYPGNAVYIGLIPLVFALGFVVWRAENLRKIRKSWHFSFFALGAGILLVLFTRWPLTEFFYSINIPFFSTGSPTNAIFLLSFCLSILAGFGLDNWMKRGQSNTLLIYIIIVLLGVLGGFAVWGRLGGLGEAGFNFKSFLYSAAILAGLGVLLFLVKFGGKKPAVWLVIFLTILDLFYFFNKFNPFVEQELVFPEIKIFSWLKSNAGIYRFWGYGTAAVEANFATQYGLYSIDGYDPLYPGRYGEFIQASKEGRILTGFSNRTRTDAVLASGFGETDLMDNRYRLKILDLLGVKYVLDRVENGSTEKTFPKERFKMVYDQDGWRIFENLKVLPRAFLVSDYRIFHGKEEFEKIFFDKDFNLREMILLEKEPVLKIGKTGGTRKIKEIKYAPNKIELEVETDSNGLLFLSDTYFPGWKAYVDNRETEIFRANYAFRAVLVSKGEHKVVLEYKPISFDLGLKTAIMSLGILGVLEGLCILRKNIWF